jgi:hypothetical protein
MSLAQIQASINSIRAQIAQLSVLVGAYSTGLAQGAANTVIGTANAVAHPIQTAKNVGGFAAASYAAGSQLASGLSNNPGKTINEIKTGYGLEFDEFSSQSSAKQMRDVGNFFGGLGAGVAMGWGIGKVADGLKSTTNIAAPYKRPSYSTTDAQRASVQGRSCATCGQEATTMIADHKLPLVKEYYQTGQIDYNNMRDVCAVQPQCPACSARQGGELSNYSKQMKNYYGF